jgi:hypothetical protein
MTAAIAPKSAMMKTTMTVTVAQTVKTPIVSVLSV